MPIQTRVEQHEAATVIYLTGAGTLDSNAELDSDLAAAIGDPPSLIVIDMSGLTMASSLVMGTLVTFRRRVRRQGGRVKLAALRPEVARAFEMAKLDQFLPMFPTLEQALAE